MRKYTLKSFRIIHGQFMRLDYQPLDIIYLLHTSSRHISLRPLLQESWHFFKPHMLLPGFVWTGPSDLHLFETRFVIGWEKKTIGMVT